MIKLIYLSPTLEEGKPKNPGDTKFFDEYNLESIKALSALLVPSNPISNKVRIAPEHQQAYQLALSYHGLEDLPLGANYLSDDLLIPMTPAEDNPFIKESQVVVNRITNTNKSSIEEVTIEHVNEVLNPVITSHSEPNPELIPPESNYILPKSSDEESLKEVVDEEASTYSLPEELNARRVELENTHHSKVRALAEQYGLAYTNKESGIKAILRKEFEETAIALGQEDLLNA